MAITTIAPTILTSSPTEYKQLVEKYYPFAKRVHVDISDGTLTPIRLLNKTENAFVKREKIHLCRGDE